MRTPTLWAGTYANAGGLGLYRLFLDSKAGLTAGAPIDQAKNASYGCYSPRHDLLYLVDERPDGRLGIFRRSGDGWVAATWVESSGDAPCFVDLAPTGDAIAVANYGSGTLALIPLESATGTPRPNRAVHRNTGRSVHERQNGPHAHCARFTPDGRWLYKTDLGTDKILAFHVGEASGLAAPTLAFAAPPGAGPRHLIFSARIPVAWLLCELDSSITLLHVGEGKLETIARFSALPGGYRGESLGGHIAVNGREDRLYVTNRGHDSVGVFALDAVGRPEALAFVPSGGRSPRHLLLREADRDMLVANEKGGTVVRFGVAADGMLARRETVRVPGAAFLIEA